MAGSFISGSGAYDERIEGSLNAINIKLVTGLPNTDVANIVVPLTGARMQGFNVASGRWGNVCLYDPASPDVPNTACALWTRIVDFPEPPLFQIWDPGLGSQALFATTTPDPTASGLGVRLIPSGAEPVATSQAVSLSTDHPSVVTREEVYTRTEFGLTRVAAPFMLFDGVSTYGINPRQWDTSVATGGAVAYEDTPGVIALSVTGASGSRARLRTHTYFLYQSGKTMRLLMTVYHADAGQSEQTRRWGLFEDNDGLFFELKGTDIKIVRRSSVSGSPVDASISRLGPNGWNVDQLDGSGPSGMTIDITKSSIYEIDLQWLSSGKVRYFIDGYLVHVSEHANTIAGPYMRTAQLPVQCEVVNTDTSTAGTMRMICAAVHIDGGQVPPMFGTSKARSAVKTGIGTTFLPVLSFRVMATFGTRQNRKIILPTRLFIANSSGKAAFRVVLNPTLTTPTWTDVLTGVSGIEYDESATSMSGGNVLLEDYLATADGRVEVNGQDFFSMLGSHLRCPAFGGAGDIMTIAAAANVGTTEIRATAAWFEVG